MSNQIVTSKEDVCPDDGAMLIVKDKAGCHYGGNCTHICPECGWHYFSLAPKADQ